MIIKNIQMIVMYPVLKAFFMLCGQVDKVVDAVLDVDE